MPANRWYEIAGECARKTLSTHFAEKGDVGGGHEILHGVLLRRTHALTGRGNAGIILVAHAWYESLCNQFPQEMERLFRECRVLLVQGPVHHPGFRGKTVRVDSISYDHATMARRIANDLNSGKVWTKERLATFYTRFEPRVDLGGVSREM